MSKKTSAGFPMAKALIVLIILASVNLLGTRFFHRWDLTENHEYTLSPSTKHVLKNLNDVVTIKVYFSKDLPSYIASLQREVKDFLDEYKAAGGSEVQVVFKDPASDPALEQSVRMLGIPKLQLSRYQKEKAEAVSAYLGIAVQYEDKTEVIPVVQTVDRLEYDLTAAVVKVSAGKKSVGIATAGSPTLDDSMQPVRDLLAKQYDVKVVDLASGPVPDDVATLVVKDDPQLTDQDLYRLDQFVMRGGRLLALAPGVDVNLGTLNARDRQVKLGPLLGSYGVQVQNRLVVDAQAPMVGFDVGYFLPLTVRYPWFPQVTADGLSRENPITSDMQSLVLPWTSPLTVTPVDSAGGGSVTADTLAESSARSFSRAAPYDLNPQSKLVPPAAGEVHPRILAVALTGRFPTHWPAGTPVPGDSLGTAVRGPAVSPMNQMVVVGSSNFLDQRFLRQFPANSVFLANAVDWMTLGNDLIAIRSREATGRPLKDVPDDKRGPLKTMAMVPVPVLVILFGLGRMRYRRERRKRYAVEYGGGRA